MKTKLTIRNCESTFLFQCPKNWSELSPTASAGVRHCNVFDRNVFFCKTDEETTEHAKAGHCIARELPDEKDFRTHTLASPRTCQFLPPSKRNRVSGLGENEPLTIQSRTRTQSVHARNATIPRRVARDLPGMRIQDGRALSE